MLGSWKFADFSEFLPELRCIRFWLVVLGCGAGCVGGGRNLSWYRLVVVCLAEGLFFLGSRITNCGLVVLRLLVARNCNNFAERVNVRGKAPKVLETVCLAEGMFFLPS